MVHRARDCKGWAVGRTRLASYSIVEKIGVLLAQRVRFEVALLVLECSVSDSGGTACRSGKLCRASDRKLIRTLPLPEVPPMACDVARQVIVSRRDVVPPSGADPAVQSRVRPAGGDPRRLGDRNFGKTGKTSLGDRNLGNLRLFLIQRGTTMQFSGFNRAGNMGF